MKHQDRFIATFIFVSPNSFTIEAEMDQMRWNTLGFSSINALEKPDK